MAKSRQTIARERKTTILYCRENLIFDIIEVLRFFNESELWNKSKYEWTIEEWEDFFQLTKIKNLL
jgi:hypothetical protein